MTAKQRAARAKFKAVVAEAKKLRKKNPKLTQAQAVKQAFAISYGKKRAEVRAVKKKAARKKKAAPTKVKAKKSKRTSEMHTDTKSHNVNIRVVSGINTNTIQEIKRILELEEKWKKVLFILEGQKKVEKNFTNKKLLSRDIMKVKNVIKDLKKNISNLKKHIN